MKKLTLFIGLLTLLLSCGSGSAPIVKPPINQKYFINPLRVTGADPWVIQHNSKYYMSESDGDQKIYVAESPTLVGLNSVNFRLVYDFSVLTPDKQRYSTWGPHINFIQGDWYIYYCAQSVIDSESKSQRMWVLKSTTNSPFGPYQDMGEILNSGDSEWSIDGSVLERSNGDLYLTWSGIDDLNTLHQKTYIAKMISPIRVDRSTITKISEPTHVWETSVRPIQEGQRPLMIDNNGKTIIMFSANASWTDEYCLGSLTNIDGDFLNPASWIKSGSPLFSKTNSIFGPGAASYVKSVDGKENWIIYHAAKSKGSGWSRQVRMQPFTWSESSDPIFGVPVDEGYKLAYPSGE